MTTVVLVIHLLLAIALVCVVLLQRSEGGGLGIGGGGGGGLLSGRGTANLLTRATAVLATLFMATSLLLAIIANRASERTSILDKASPAATTSAPAQPQQAPQPQGPSVPLAN
ncbi:MAG: preprotein translocase subunit SecG [Proteobacteria bacterium]|nr:preprotein translocase subunit SecG [Pseudomonadota bacterium]